MLDLNLAWSAPAECPSRDAVVAEVERLLGGPPENAPDVSARAEISRSDKYHLRLTLSIDKRERSRDLEAPTCAALADTAALIVALAIDPFAGESGRTPPRTATPPPPEPPAPSAPAVVTPPPPGPAHSPVGYQNLFWPLVPPPQLPVTPPTPAPRPRSAFHAHAAVAWEQGTFGRPALSGRAGAAFVRPPLRVELAGVFDWIGQIDSTQKPGKGGTFWRLAADLAGCVERPIQARAGATAAACAGVEVGAVDAAGFGVLRPKEGTSPWVAPFFGAIGRFPLVSGLALRFDVEVLVPVIRADFQIQGVGVVTRPGPAGARGDAGLELTLGQF